MIDFSKLFGRKATAKAVDEKHTDDAKVLDNSPTQDSSEQGEFDRAVNESVSEFDKKADTLSNLDEDASSDSCVGGTEPKPDESGEVKVTSKATSHSEERRDSDYQRGVGFLRRNSRRHARQTQQKRSDGKKDYSGFLRQSNHSKGDSN